MWIHSLSYINFFGSNKFKNVPLLGVKNYAINEMYTQIIYFVNLTLSVISKMINVTNGWIFVFVS